MSAAYCLLRNKKQTTTPPADGWGVGATADGPCGPSPKPTCQFVGRGRGGSLLFLAAGYSRASETYCAKLAEARANKLPACEIHTARQNHCLISPLLPRALAKTYGRSLHPYSEQRADWR